MTDLFRKAGLGSFKELLEVIRCREADKLICDSNLKMNQIAEKCGFSSAKVFANHFKRYSGVTPTQRRKVYRTMKKAPEGRAVEFGSWICTETAYKVLGRRRLKKIRMQI